MAALAEEVRPDRYHRPRLPVSRLDFAVTGVITAGALLLLPRLATFWEITTSLVHWPWQFDFDEGHNLNATVLLAHGTNIYQKNSPEHFISAPYTPLFYVANAPFTWLMGPTFGPGRLLSALATLSIAALLAVIVYSITRRWSPGLLAGALWLSISPVIVWAGFYKQDMPALALQVAGLAWALRYCDSNRRYGAVLFFALAFFTKQSAITAACAVSLWLLLRDWRTGIRFVALMTAAISLPFFGADLLLHGGLSLHVIGYQWKPWNPAYVGHLLGRLWSEYWPTIIASGGVLGCASVLTLLRGLRGKGVPFYLAALGSPWGLIGLYALASAGWVCIATGIKGGNYNLLLDCVPSLALLAPLGAGWLLYRLAGLPLRLRLWAAAGTVLLAGLFIAQRTAFDDPRSWYHANWPGAQQEQFMQSLSDLISRTPGDIYSEDDYLVLHSGRPVLYDDPSTFPILAESGRWDDSVFNRALRDRRFGLIILWPGSGRWTSEGYKAFEDDYKLAYADSLETYLPKLVPDEPQYPISCRLQLGSDAILIDGYSLSPGVAGRGVRPGEVLHIALTSQAAVQLRRSYASFVHIIDESGKVLAGRDEPATGAGRPTTEWSPGKRVTDDIAVPVPADAPPGRYRLVLGMYVNDGGKLTPLVPACADAGQLYGDAIAPGWVNVVRP